MCNGYGGGGANQKFPFLHFRLSAGGQGGAVKKWKEIFGFATRESASASEALGIEWPRNRSVRFRFKPPRTRSVRNQPLRGWKWVRVKVSMSAHAKELCPA